MQAKSRLCRSSKAAQRLDRICLVTLIDVATSIIEKELWKFNGHGKSLKLRIYDERKHRLSSLQHNIPRSFYLVVIFWNLLQIIQLSICDVIVIIKKMNEENLVYKLFVAKNV